MKKIILLTLACLQFLSFYAFAQFTIGVIPDTQKLTSSEFGDPDELFERMKDIARWYADHKEELNIVFVTHLGDMTEDKDVAIQWQRNIEAWQILINAGIPFAPCQGNQYPNLDFRCLAQSHFSFWLKKL